MAVETEQDDTVAPMFRPMSITALLGALVAVAMLPTLAFALYVFDRNNQAQERILTSLASTTAGAATESVDRLVAGKITTLRAFSTSRSYRSNDLAAFYGEAVATLEGSDNYLIVADNQFNQLFNTRMPFGSSLGKVTDTPPAAFALQTLEPVVSDAFVGGVSRKWVFNAILPTSEVGQPQRLLIMTQDAETLTKTLAMENLTGGWNAAIVDRNSVVLATTFVSSDIGKRFFLENPKSGSVAVAADGQRYELVQNKSDVTGWTVKLWADSDVLRGPMYRTYRLMLSGGIALVALGALAAWFFGRQIARSVQRLGRDAARLGSGQPVTAHTLPVTELTTVSEALASAATSRRAAENEIRFLMREVAHRSKNQLTVVSSLAKQSARGAETVDAFTESFQERILGLARSTDLLIAGSVAGVELEELLQAQIEPFRPQDSSQLRLDGPAFRLTTEAAQTLGLALHELATNASKYGALSAPGGTLSVTWVVVDGHLELRWEEKTTQKISKPERKGFGTRLIIQTLGRALSAEIDTQYRPNGIDFRMKASVSKLMKDEGAGQAT